MPVSKKPESNKQVLGRLKAQKKKIIKKIDEAVAAYENVRSWQEDLSQISKEEDGDKCPFQRSLNPTSKCWGA